MFKNQCQYWSLNAGETTAQPTTTTMMTMMMMIIIIIIISPEQSNIFSASYTHFRINRQNPQHKLGQKIRTLSNQTQRAQPAATQKNSIQFNSMGIFNIQDIQHKHLLQTQHKRANKTQKNSTNNSKQTLNRQKYNNTAEKYQYERITWVRSLNTDLSS